MLKENIKREVVNGDELFPQELLDEISLMTWDERFQILFNRINEISPQEIIETFNILPEEFTSLIQKVIIDQITIRMILNSYSIQSL